MKWKSEKIRWSRFWEGTGKCKLLIEAECETTNPKQSKTKQKNFSLVLLRNIINLDPEENKSCAFYKVHQGPELVFHFRINCRRPINQILLI